MAGLVFAGTSKPLSGRPARRHPLRRSRAAAGDLVRRPRRSRVMGNVAPIVMSALLFAGSAQFAATAVLGAGGGVVAAIAAGILLNLRYVPMGIALAPSLRGAPWRRALRRAGDDRLLVGGGEPRRRALRPRVHARRHRPVLSVLGPRDRDRRLRRRPDRRSRGARARRDLPRLLPLPAGRGRAAPRPAAGRRRARQPDRPRPDPVHARRGAGDRGLGRRAARPPRRPRARPAASADERRLGDDRGAHGGDRC